MRRWLRNLFRNLFGLWRIGALARIGGESADSLVKLANPPQAKSTKAPREKRAHRYHRRLDRPIW